MTSPKDGGSGLEPCPFCGSVPRPTSGGVEDPRKFVECTNKFCFSEGPRKVTQLEAIAAWNTRRYQAQAPAIEAAEAAKDAVVDSVINFVEGRLGGRAINLVEALSRYRAALAAVTKERDDLRTGVAPSGPADPPACSPSASDSAHSVPPEDPKVAEALETIDQMAESVVRHPSQQTRGTLCLEHLAAAYRSSEASVKYYQEENNKLRDYYEQSEARRREAEADARLWSGRAKEEVARNAEAVAKEALVASAEDMHEYFEKDAPAKAWLENPYSPNKPIQKLVRGVLAALALLSSSAPKEGCVCPDPGLHKKLAEGRPIDPSMCAKPEKKP